MPLPQISTPTYELTIPSSKKKIKYRPFLVREEKILILALESENEKQIADAIKSTLKSCIITRGIKIDSLSTFSLYFHLIIRLIIFKIWYFYVSVFTTSFLRKRDLSFPTF